jgi:hypothetical protein
LKKKVTTILAPHLYRKTYSRALFTLYGQVIKECRVALNQFFTWRYPIFSFIRVIGNLASSLLRLFLGRGLKYSYSFTGEDRILESLCKPLITENGFYVDVGCNRPIFLSNTYLFYKRGWRGICVDANGKLIKKYSRFRPRDKAICALVSDSGKEKEFYKLSNDVLSTTEAHIVTSYLKQGYTSETTLMQPQSLTQVLDNANAPTVFNILSIDVEEHDFNVLQSLDFNKYTPEIIVIEIEDFTPDKPESNRVFNFLSTKGYSLEGFVLTNLYFKKINHSFNKCGN